MEVFRAYGYGGTTVARIAADTGIGKGSLYHFFPGGKPAMAAAALGHVRAWFEREIFAPLRAEAPPAERIARTLDATEAYFLVGGRVCLVGAFALDDARDVFAEAVEGYFGGWRGALAEAFGAAGVSEEQAGAYAEEVVAGIQGALVLSRALGEEGVFRARMGVLRGRCGGWVGEDEMGLRPTLSSVQRRKAN